MLITIGPCRATASQWLTGDALETRRYNLAAKFIQQPKRIEHARWRRTDNACQLDARAIGSGKAMHRAQYPGMRVVMQHRRLAEGDLKMSDGREPATADAPLQRQVAILSGLCAV